MDLEKKKEKDLKRRHSDNTGYGRGEDVSEDSEDERQAREWKDRGNKEGVVIKDLGKLQGMSSASVIKQLEQDKGKKKSMTGAMKKREKKPLSKKGHRVVASGDAYRSDKGKGDVLKVGKHEPYAYFQLNPEMLNPRKKKQAVQTFEGVVSHGKKTDKRTGKKVSSGAFAGLSIKKKWASKPLS